MSASRWLLLAGLLASGSEARAQGADTTLRLKLNVPAYRLEVREAGRPDRSVRVAIGMRDHPTPLGRYAITSITWNPWWYPPRRPWAARDTITPPCPGNPVGRVKLNFSPLYYLHGTPNSRSLGHAASHGCVRMDQGDALALAGIVVRHVMPESLPRLAAWATDDSVTRHRALPRPVPLEISYDLAEVRDDTLWLYPDPYRRVPASAARLALALSALAVSGRDTVSADRARLRALVSASRRAPAFLPLQPVLTRCRETEEDP